MDSTSFMPSEAAIAGIRADLDRYEAERVKAHRAVRWRVPVFLGLWIAAVFLLALALNGVADPFEQWKSSPHVFLYFFGVVGAIFVHLWAYSPAHKLQQSFREKALPVVFGFIKDVTYSNGRRPGSFDRLPREALDTFNRETFDDVVTGRYEDFAFELYEARLKHKVGKSDSEIFRGVIVAFEAITPFPGLLVATRKKGSVTNFFRGLFGMKLEELTSGNAAIDEAYEFRSDNPEAARPLVAGRLAQALTWLRSTWPEQPARLALKGSDGFLLIPVTKNFFELPEIAVPLDYDTHVRPIIADMGTLLATVSLVRKIGAADDAPA